MLLQEEKMYVYAEKAVWCQLYIQQLEKIKKFAYSPFIDNLSRLEFSPGRVPGIVWINQHLKEINGWKVYEVAGLLDNHIFFEKMADKAFGVTTWLRKPEELDYLEEPDMFHDVFGHVPLLCDPLISDYLHQMAIIALKYITNEDAIEAIARLYWYTIEFGMVIENGNLKIYGAGILSSIGETDYCLSDKANRVPFNLQRVLDTPYIKDNFQAQYFVLDCLEQLNLVIGQLELFLAKDIAKL
ncbi:MAG: phenylalanine-4-hydroxylase [Bacteroidota bacterium]